MMAFFTMPFSEAYHFLVTQWIRVIKGQYLESINRFFTLLFINSVFLGHICFYKAKNGIDNLSFEIIFFLGSIGFMKSTLEFWWEIGKNWVGALLIIRKIFRLVS